MTTAETIDGSSRYLIPGLRDMHVHLTCDDAFTEAIKAASIQPARFFSPTGDFSPDYSLFDQARGAREPVTGTAAESCEASFFLPSP